MLHFKWFLFLSCTDFISDFMSWQVEDFSIAFNLTQMQIHFCFKCKQIAIIWWWVRHDWATSTFTFHLHALEKAMATHSSVLAWRIPGTVEPGGLLSMGSHRVGHDWSDLATAKCFLESFLQDLSIFQEHVTCIKPLMYEFSQPLPFFMNLLRRQQRIKWNQLFPIWISREYPELSNKFIYRWIWVKVFLFSELRDCHIHECGWKQQYIAKTINEEQKLNWGVIYIIWAIVRPLCIKTKCKYMQPVVDKKRMFTASVEKYITIYPLSSYSLHYLLVQIFVLFASVTAQGHPLSSQPVWKNQSSSFIGLCSLLF